MDEVVVQQHVVDATLLAQTVEVVLAQPRAPLVVESPHALALRRRIVGVVAAVERLLIERESLDDVRQLTGGIRDRRQSRDRDHRGRPGSVLRYCDGRGEEQCNWTDRHYGNTRLSSL